MPLLGTGLSRTNLSYKEAYELIKDKCMNNLNKINGEISIVLYSNDLKKWRKENEL